MADGAADLVEGLLEVRRNGEHVARIAQRHLLAQVDGHLVVVGRVERRDLAHPLRPEPRAGAIGGAPVEGDAQHGGVVILHLRHVLGVGRLEEGVDPCVMRQLAPREGRDRLVLDRVRAGQPHAQRPATFLVPPAFGQTRLGLHRFPALQLREVGVMSAPVPQGAVGWVMRAGALNWCHAVSPSLDGWSDAPPAAPGSGGGGAGGWEPPPEPGVAGVPAS
jgi:hypothetical protein